MPRQLPLPRLYPILDAGLLASRGLAIEDFAQQLRDAGIRFLQYRDKQASDEVFLERAARLRAIFPAGDCCLILNDRVPLFGSTGYDGLHVGQGDMPPAEVRALLGRSAWLGFSTHNEEQVLQAESAPVDYLAIGPVYATQSKAVPDPVTGLAGVHRARARTARPLVAIGGITSENCAAVIAAGADSVAIISALLPAPGRTVAQNVRAFSAALSR